VFKVKIVIQKDHTYELEKRYSEFADFRSMSPLLGSSVVFPGKSATSMSEAKLEARRIGLEMFLQNACVTCAGSAELNKFLSIPAELQAAVGAAKPIKEGMLSKQGHLRKNWQSR
jgi:hypothetical protein